MGLIVIFVGSSILNINSRTIWNCHLPAPNVTLISLARWKRTQLTSTSASSVGKGVWVFPGNRIGRFILRESRLLSWTADDRYFQKPPAEQFISLSSCTAPLNNAQWRKTLEARCSDARLCIHKELISAATTLFICPLHAFMFYTPCRKSRHRSQLQLSLGVTVASSSQCCFFLSVVFAWWAVWFSSGPLRVFLCLSTYSLLFLLWGGTRLYLCGWGSTSGSVKVCRASWRWQPAVCCFISHFSATTSSRGNALISTDPTALFV